AGVLLMGRDGRQDVWTLQTPDGGLVRVRMQSRFESNFGELVRDAVVAGQGIAVHSYWHIADELRSGRLVEVMRDYPPPTSHISAVTPARQLQPPRVRAFVDFLLERLGEQPPWDLAT
ncbi:LysR substrate-binding domain-containing protein, partial [Xanthomonas perforans]